MFVVRPPSPALLSQQGIPLGLPQIPCQPHMLNQFMPNMIFTCYYFPVVSFVSYEDFSIPHRGRFDLFLLYGLSGKISY
jgi:hypothetical protein